MTRLLAVLVLLATIGCASNSGVVETGPDSYMISRQGASAFTGLGTMKADSIKEAGVFCKKESKILQVSGTQDIPAGFGRLPYAEIQFMCLSLGDSRLKGGPLVPIYPASADKIVNGK